MCSNYRAAIWNILVIVLACTHVFQPLIFVSSMVLYKHTNGNWVRSLSGLLYGIDLTQQLWTLHWPCSFGDEPAACSENMFDFKATHSLDRSFFQTGNTKLDLNSVMCRKDANPVQLIITDFDLKSPSNRRNLVVVLTCYRRLCTHIRLFWS